MFFVINIYLIFFLLFYHSLSLFDFISYFNFTTFTTFITFITFFYISLVFAIILILFGLILDDVRVVLVGLGCRASEARVPRRPDEVLLFQVVLTARRRRQGLENIALLEWLG